MNKFAVFALLGYVSAQDDVSVCDTKQDCEDNFDALYEKWLEDGGDDAAEPISG